MKNKLKYYCDLSERTQRELTSSLERWTSFLTTAARLYKYPYHEQVMIHAQRPDATACAPYELWNQVMHRYVKRGSKGIALVNIVGEEPMYWPCRANCATRSHWEMIPEAI